MSLFHLLLILGLFGVLLFLFNKYVTAFDARVKQLVNIVVIIALVLLCLWAFGVMDVLKGTRVPRL